jgi:NAD(P)-dependent dehydrogenase (short-subunit alcohol dehydrogenase family)|tara:strand:+ start:799 stop:1560 length:762 start_codon:yes stop_codon:yes gene_type:complete
MHELDGKVALVTGAGMGLGQACALTMAEQGARVMVADLNDEAGQETVNTIEQRGGTASFVRVDVADASAVETMVKHTVDTYGRLDSAVNNAGIVGDGAPVANESESNWDLVMSINLKGVFLCCKYQVRQMLEQGGGAIVNMSSVMGLNGNAGGVSYAASKHGVIGITKCVALENAQTSIRVNAICPGIMKTPLVDGLISRSGGAFADYAITSTPMARIGEPEEVARTAAWLCSDAASYITGTALPVDGGFNAQ